MKKLFIVLIILLLFSCANDDINKDNIIISTPIFSENSLKLGINNIDYNKDKTFNTLIYYATSPVTDNYIMKNRYNIASKNNDKYDDLNSNNISAKFIEKQNLKNSINDINRYIQQYTYDNNISPIEYNSNILKRAVPSPVEVGTKWENIYLLDTDNDTYSIINATCIAVSESAYFFMQDDFNLLTQEQIDEIVVAFDKDYNIIHKYYGEETDTDGNGKVSFLIANFSPDLFGFFYTADKYRQQDLPRNIKSNQADILYVNYYYFLGDNWEKYKTDLKATFIHEFQHMVLFDCRSRLHLNTNIGTWINEGLSMLAEFYGGYTAPHYRYIAGYFNSNQGISLITNDSSLDYGLSYLFLRYMQIRFSDNIIKKIYSSKNTGINVIEEASNMNFNELFLDFAKMILVTGREITTDIRYNIDEFNYPAGSVGYERNGFNLSQVIDEVYSYNSYNNIFITSQGYKNKKISLYGFVITKWSDIIDTIELTGNTGIAGMFATW